MSIEHIKTVVFAIALSCNGFAVAQPIQTLPNGSGGYNTYGRNGALTQTHVLQDLSDFFERLAS